MRPIAAISSVCAVALVLANLAMIPWSHRLPYRRKLDKIHAAQDPNLVFIGDSLLDTRVDEAAFMRGAASAGQSYRPLNAAFVSTLPPDHALLMDYAVAQKPTLRTVVVGLMDFQLTRNGRFLPMELTGNHEIGADPVFPISLVSKINRWDAADRMELRLLRLAPMAVNRRNAWQYTEILRRSMGQIGMPPEKTNALGRLRDMVALEAGSVEEFDQEAEEFLKGPSHFNLPYEEVFATAARQKMKVVLVVMPMSQEHRSHFYARDSWHDYLAKLRALAIQRGFTVIDASDWVQDGNCFIDNVHMAPCGATTFSQHLGQELPDSSH